MKGNRKSKIIAVTVVVIFFVFLSVCIACFSQDKNSLGAAIAFGGFALAGVGSVIYYLWLKTRLYTVTDEDIEEGDYTVKTARIVNYQCVCEASTIGNIYKVELDIDGKTFFAYMDTLPTIGSAVEAAVRQDGKFVSIMSVHDKIISDDDSEYEDDTRLSFDEIVDKESALLDELDLAGFDELIEAYSAESEPVWENYTGEDYDESMDILGKLITKYRALFEAQKNQAEITTETSAVEVTESQQDVAATEEQTPPIIDSQPAEETA